MIGGKTGLSRLAIPRRRAEGSTTGDAHGLDRSLPEFSRSIGSPESSEISGRRSKGEVRSGPERPHRLRFSTGLGSSRDMPSGRGVFLQVYDHLLSDERSSQVPKSSKRHRLFQIAEHKEGWMR